MCPEVRYMILPLGHQCATAQTEDHPIGWCGSAVRCYPALTDPANG